MPRPSKELGFPRHRARASMIDRSERIHFSALAADVRRPHPGAYRGAGPRASTLAGQVRRAATIMAYADGLYLVGVALVLILAAIALRVSL